MKFFCIFLPSGWKLALKICIFAKITSKIEQFHAHFIWQVFWDWKIFIKFLQCALYSKQKTLSWSSYLVTLYVNDASSFSAENNGHVIDIVYYLQNYPGGWENGEFREKMDIQECTRPPPYHKNSADDLLKGKVAI